MKMGRRLRCSSVTYRFRYAPLLPPVRLGPPCRRPILIATKAMLFMGQDTSFSRVSGAVVTKRHETQRLIAVEIADSVNSAALRENNAARLYL